MLHRQQQTTAAKKEEKIIWNIREKSFCSFHRRQGRQWTQRSRPVSSSSLRGFIIISSEKHGRILDCVSSPSRNCMYLHFFSLCVSFSLPVWVLWAYKFCIVISLEMSIAVHRRVARGCENCKKIHKTQLSLSPIAMRPKGIYAILSPTLRTRKVHFFLLLPLPLFHSCPSVCLETTLKAQWEKCENSGWGRV